MTDTVKRMIYFVPKGLANYKFIIIFVINLCKYWKIQISDGQCVILNKKCKIRVKHAQQIYKGSMFQLKNVYQFLASSSYNSKTGLPPKNCRLCCH